ncbi:hypothetical protein V8G69_14515 [Gaetbulibacter sp. M235]|uniref:PKD domain-containing protein n=1 Tax=Gaetbulibacter sp. M235 TaxID=3126510 RepID=UPI00374E931D
MKKVKISFNLMLTIVTALGFLSACQPDDVGSGNGILGPELDASFTVTAVANQTNTFTLKAVATNYIGSKWDFGKGGGTTTGKSEETVSYPDKGTYTVTHTAVGIGGQSYSSSQDIIVDTSDPIAGNIIQGGKFESADDWSKWNILNITPVSGSAFWAFTPGSATVSFPDPGNQAIYQAIDVDADTNYSIDMQVSSPNGINLMWFEVYCLPQVPAQGSDYGNVGAEGVWGLNYWVGCGRTPFNGLLSDLSCVGKFHGIVSFPTSGTVYLVIKAGCQISGNTVTIKNVEMRRIS